MKKKILIIGKNSFIGNGLFNYLKKKFFVKKISFKNFDNNVNNYKRPLSFLRKYLYFLVINERDKINKREYQQTNFFTQNN